jgi:hypothetical protein
MRVSILVFTHFHTRETQNTNPRMVPSARGAYIRMGPESPQKYQFSHATLTLVFAGEDTDMTDAANSDATIYEDDEMHQLRGKLEKALERLIGGIAPVWSEAQLALQTLLTILRNILQVRGLLFRPDFFVCFKVPYETVAWTQL